MSQHTHWDPLRKKIPAWPRMRRNPRFHLGDLTLPFADGEFDLIYTLFVLMHISDSARALREMHRILRPGGRIVLHEGFHDAIWLSPALSEFKQVLAIWGQKMTEQGQDDSIGLRAFELLARQDLEAIEVQVVPNSAHSGTPSDYQITETRFANLVSDIFCTERSRSC